MFAIDNISQHTHIHTLAVRFIVTHIYNILSSRNTCIYSTLAVRWIMSPSLKPSSPSFSGSKSYRALARGVSLADEVMEGEGGL